MSLSLNPGFSRMIEGRVSRPCPPNQPHVNYSTNTTFHRQSTLQGYSLKFVLSGTEHYWINQQEHSIREGQYLLVSHGSAVEVEIDSRSPVHGLCLFLSTAQIQDVWRTLQLDPAALLESPAASEPTPFFEEQAFSARHTVLGQQLARLARQISTEQFDASELTETLFYDLATLLCQQHQEYLRHLNRVPAQKQATRDELYRRLRLAREYIHDNFSSPIRLADMAGISCLSEYHFLRTFKTVFGESPYQYLLQLRLQKAGDLLRFGSLPIIDIALACGFEEVQAFSKLFRKQHGMGPLRFRQLHQT